LRLYPNPLETDLQGANSSLSSAKYFEIAGNIVNISKLRFKITCVTNQILEAGFYGSYNILGSFDLTVDAVGQTWSLLWPLMGKIKMKVFGFIEARKHHPFISKLHPDMSPFIFMIRG